MIIMNDINIIFASISVKSVMLSRQYTKGMYTKTIIIAVRKNIDKTRNNLTSICFLSNQLEDGL